jgi:hypothetical protein
MMPCYCPACTRQALLRQMWVGAVEPHPLLPCPACKTIGFCAHCNGYGCTQCGDKGKCHECGGSGYFEQRDPHETIDYPLG